METSNNISNNGSVFSLNQSLPAKMLDNPNRRPGVVKTNRPSKNSNSVSGMTGVHRGHFGVDKLEAIHSRLNSLAKTIRITDKKMEKIENCIDSMKAELQGVIKNFPPFPIGSEERVKRLKAFNASRKMIDQLTIPPPKDEHVAKIASEPDEFDIPQLKESSDDKEIRVALESLDIAKKKIKQSRSDLSADVAGIISSFEQEIKAAGIIRSYGEELKTAETESEAELTSRELSYTLTIEPGMTLTEAQSQLLTLLN